MLTTNGDSSRDGRWLIVRKARDQAAERLVSLAVYISGSLIVSVLQLQVPVRAPSGVLFPRNPDDDRPFPRALDAGHARPEGCEDPAVRQIRLVLQVAELRPTAAREKQGGTNLGVQGRHGIVGV